jgi:hypothetical protein
LNKSIIETKGSRTERARDRSGISNPRPKGGDFLLRADSPVSGAKRQKCAQKREQKFLCVYPAGKRAGRNVRGVCKPSGYEPRPVLSMLIPRLSYFLGGFPPGPFPVYCRHGASIKHPAGNFPRPCGVRRRFNLLITCVIFGTIWGLWHAPLGLIKGSYQEAVAETGLVYSINFMVSLAPYLIMDNWLYYKTNRNMLLEILFHFEANFFNEIFRTHPGSKIIQTVLLLIFSVVIICKEKTFFFSRSPEEIFS